MSLENSYHGFGSHQAQVSFGRHPGWFDHFNRCVGMRPLLFEPLREGMLTPEGEVIFRSTLERRLPGSEVLVIPEDRYLYVIDRNGQDIDQNVERFRLWFSSSSFKVDTSESRLFGEFYRPIFFRLAGISQFGYLIQPEEVGAPANQLISYLEAPFSHSRYEHSLLVAILMEVILARNGFSQEVRAPVVLTAGFHDIAMPAGGDSIKRVDPQALDEEANFGLVLKSEGLDELWRREYGFDLAIAEQWVRNEGLFGRLLDVIDRLSYTALDCYRLGCFRRGKIRDLCIEHPLILDVWEDIKFTPDGTDFAFVDPERLFLFILLRAYEHEQFLFDPRARTLDHFIRRKAAPLYESGELTKDQLLMEDDKWLIERLRALYPDEFWVITPDEIFWREFATQDEQERFAASIGKKLDRMEHIKGFDPCLDWPVWCEGNIVPLRSVISSEKVGLLEDIVASTRGYYVYYLRS